MTELVILADDSGRAIGTAPKADVHGRSTPLHLAFSCYLLDESGRILLTRRALAKKTWPGVWTNSFCGHPAPGEDLLEAVSRRAEQELGASIDSLRFALPEFRYRAVDAGGTEENEICPVFVARLDGSLDPSASEVAEVAWADPEDLVGALERAPFAFSPWMAEQLPLLTAAGSFENAHD